jgi:hypothetical protein
MQFSSSSTRLGGQQTKNKNVNPFLSGSGSSGIGIGNSNNSNNSNSNAFMNKEQLLVNKEVAKEAAKEAAKESAKEEFPTLTATATTTATKPNSQSSSSYKNLLVSTIDRRMAEEQLKLRADQAAEVERSKEYYSKVLISDVRAARAAAAANSNAAAATDLELMYDEDGGSKY